MLMHNAWPAMWAKVNADAVAGAGRKGDILYFMRAGYTGVQAHCPLLWAGDQSVDFSRHDGLQTVICGALSSGMLGNAYHHSDIGGYTSLFGNRRTPELFQRWAEMAAFTPVMRTHEGNRPDENFQFWQDEAVLAHFARMTRIYVALAPYVRRLSAEAANRGLPLQRPLFLHFEGDPEAYEIQDQYLYGEDLLVAPVHEAGCDEWEPYLPAGAPVDPPLERAGLRRRRARQGGGAPGPAAGVRSRGRPGAGRAPGPRALLSAAPATFPRATQSHTMKRSTSLDRIRSATEPFDVLVVGGGATGLGAALDAAARGHRVALIEQHDFAKGTSSRSTKLVHGGVRYLRQGNISLVLEALRERGRLALNAPHLVHDLAFVIPSYKWWEGPFYGIGMKVYDQLAGKLGLKPSRVLSLQETLELIPTVEPENLTGGVVYHDGQFDDARLAVNLAQTADELGAAMLNYCRCVGLVKEKDIVTGVLARDQESGEELTIRARSVINATGVFVDDLRQLDERDRQEARRREPGHPLRAAEGLPARRHRHHGPEDGRRARPVRRAVARLRRRRHDRHARCPSHSLEPRALDEERDFVMSHARRYLAKDPSDGDVLSIFAGLRPLVKSGDSSNTAALSRDHTILVSKSGLITITGGKWTTYRKMAEDVIDYAETVAGVESTRCRTETMHIHGWTQADIREKNLEPYGSDAVRIAEMIKAAPDLAGKLHPALPYQQGEVVWHVRNEMARTVEDVLARRTRSLILNARASIEAAPLVARLVAAELGRDEAWQAAQVAEYTALARGYVYTDPESRRAPGAEPKRAGAQFD